MRNHKHNILIAFLFCFAALAGCKKELTEGYVKDFKSFNFSKSFNPELNEDIEGVITENEVILRVPNYVNLASLIPSFETVNPRNIIQVKGAVQENNVTALDFTEPVEYRLKAEDFSTKTYTVKVLKNAAITSFGFYKEDNPTLLAKDYPGVVTGLNIKVELPRSVPNRTQLVARFTTTEGAEVKVNGTVQTSKTSANDFSAPVEYKVTDAETLDPETFTVTVIDIQNPEWVMIGNDLTVPTAGNVRMAINPITNYPAIVYQRTGTDEAGVSIPTADRKIAAMAFNGTAWQALGDSRGISDYRADNASIAFDKSGNAYVGYKDYFNSENKMTVLKYSGTSWQVVGAPRFTPFKIDYPFLAISDNNDPYVSMIKDGATPVPALPNRGVYAMSYKNGTWSDAFAPSTTAFFTHLNSVNGKLYMGIMDRASGGNRPSVFMENNGSWTAVGPTSFTAPNGLVGAQVVETAVAPDGTVYAVYQVSLSGGGGRIIHVMKFNGASWEELGNAVNVQGESDKFAIAVSPNGTLFFAYGDPGAVYCKTFNNETNNWNTPVQVINGRVNSFDMQISKTGIPYLVASMNADNKTVAYKFDLP